MQAAFIQKEKRIQQDFWCGLMNVHVCIAGEPCATKPAYGEAQSMGRGLELVSWCRICLPCAGGRARLAAEKSQNVF